MTPTCRSLDRLRRQGWLAAVVEKWLPKLDRRQDLFGFGDILAAHPVERAVTIIQATTAGHVAHRLAKAKARPGLLQWLRSGGRFSVWGWDGSRLRAVDVTLGDLAEVVIATPPRRARAAKQRELFA